MSSKDQLVNTLIDMGFGNNRAVRGLQATGFKGVEPAMEWLLAHSGDETLDEPFTEEEAGEMKAELEAPPKAPLTEEEKKEKLAKLEELRVKKRAERLDKEAAEAKEKEKRRVESGKDMGQIRAAIEEQEIRKLAVERRREKDEEKAAKARVLAQIEADKAARKAEREAGRAGAAAQQPAAAAAPAPAQTVKKDYTEARLQVRLPAGQPLVHTFGAKEPLSAVRLYIEMNRSDGGAGPFRLMTNFPKKVFNDEDYENTLENLGLVPSAVLMVTK